MKARAQLNRLLWAGEKRASVREERGGAGGRARAGRKRSMAAAPAPASVAPWFNATLAYNATRPNDTDFELLNAAADDHDDHWFCAKWTSAQQDLFQVRFITLKKGFQKHLFCKRLSLCIGGEPVLRAGILRAQAL